VVKVGYTFRKQVIGGCLLVVCLGSALVYRMVSIDSESVDAYYKLEASSAADHNRPKEYTTRLLRSNPSKEVYQPRGDERIQMKVIADSSEIAFNTDQSGTTIVEELSVVHCDIQEDLYYLLSDGRQAVLQANGQYLVKAANSSKAVDAIVDSVEANAKPMQTVRHLEAEAAVYDYNQGLLTSDHVTLLRHQADGHQLSDQMEPQTLLMEGDAQDVECSLSGKGSYFKSQRIKGTFYTTDGLF
jgi:hypothetical protein